MLREKGYAQISLPIDLIKKIDELIKSGRGGYRSRAEFVKDAVRRLLREYGYTI